MKIKNKTIKILFVILICLLIMLIYITKNYNKTTTNQQPAFITEDGELYAHGYIDKKEGYVWNKWKNYEGKFAKKDYKYFILPKTSDSNRVEIYNNFNEDVKINNIIIKAKKMECIDYKEGEELEVIVGDKSYKLIIYRSDAESSVFVSDTREFYKDYSGQEIKKELFFFLVRNKNNFVKDLNSTIINENDCLNTTLKKIKGRGNSSWYHHEKKPFNLTFEDMTLIGKTKSKKFSLISPTCDTTMLRNQIMCDLADYVGLPFSPTISYMDFYVNGNYKGCYNIAEKVEMGKNALIKLENNSKNKDEDFNFLIEVDTTNYKDDTYFETTNGYKIVLKTPDLDDYSKEELETNKKYQFIKETYQKFEDSLYKGTIEDLEKICDIESLAKMYLIQEFGKNCDGGLSSTYFYYNAEDKKFYASPIWDCDTMLGSLDIIQEGYTVSSANFKEWLTKTATYNGVLNPLAKAFELPGKTSEGKTFEKICKTIWNEKFISAINIILGKEEKKGRLMSMDEYKKSNEKAIFCNYIMWEYETISPSESSGLEKEYSKDYNGEIEYLKDWVEARADWMTLQFNE